MADIPIIGDSPGRSLMAQLQNLAGRLSGLPVLLVIAVVWLVLMLAVALLADLIPPYPYTQMDLHNRLSTPVFMGGTWAHPLGTDELGRDVLSRLIASIRMSLLIAFGATIIGAVIGVTLGFVAAHFRGFIEQVVLALVDFSAAIPFLVLALAVLAFFGNSITLFICLLGLHAWERYARIARGLAISGNAQGAAVKRAENQGCVFVLENIEDKEPADRRKLVESFNSPAFAISIDTGHAAYAHGSTGAPPVDYFVLDAGEMLQHVHLQDADGYADRHWPLGYGDINWRAIFAQLAGITSNPRLIIEIRDKSKLQASAAHLAALGLAQ